jgi:hypothetical protein
MWYTKQAEFNFYSEECVCVLRKFKWVTLAQIHGSGQNIPGSYGSKPTYVTTSYFFLRKLQELITCVGHYFFRPSLLLRGL